MPSYKYRVIHKDGTVQQRESEADSVEGLRKEIEAKGAFVDQVKEVKHRQWSLFSKNKINKRQVYLFVHEFISLLKAGVTIPDILKHLANRPSQPYLSRVLQELRQKVMNGQALSQSMESYHGVFDRMFINAVMIGEKNGQLINSLNSYLAYLKLNITIQQKVRAALVYPVFLSLMLVIAVAVLFFFVMPRFTSMYAEFGAELPLPTKILMGVVNYSHVIVPVGIGVFVLLIAGVKYWVANHNGKYYLDRMWLSVPGIRDITVPFNISNSASAMATLLSVGMPLVDAIRSASKSNSNSYIATKLEKAAFRMTEGQGVAETMRELELMDESALTMIRAGEKSGELVSILREISSFNADRLNDSIARHLALIEPLIMLIMGLVVGGIIFVMYLPIFSIAEVIK